MVAPAARSRRIAPLLAIVALMAGCSRRVERPNVLLLLADAVRADHLGCYGYARDTSPRIDAFARDSLLYSRAYAQAPWTKPSIPTLLTSLYPIQHGVYEGEKPGSAGVLESDVLSGNVLTIAEAFHAAGYRTAAFVHNAQLPAGHGFSQGFETYEQGDLDAAEINRRFLAFAARDHGRPFFAYLHYLDAHWPFRPRSPFDSRFPTPPARLAFTADDWRGLRDRINEGTLSLGAGDRARLVSLHDGAIAALDERIGELFDALSERRLLSRTVVLLTSDHGEELLDHGQVGHGGTLFEEVIRIPMILRVPGTPGRHVKEEIARTVDVFPTLLDAAGLGVPAGLEGRSLIAASGNVDRAALLPELVSETRHKRTYRVAVRSGRWKYIRTCRAARGDVPTSVQLETFGLGTGMRVKVKGRFLEDGTLVAERVSVQDGHDRDAEVSGPVAELDRKKERFRLHVFTVVAGRKLLDRSEGMRVVDLSAGQWVKAEGRMARDRTVVVADKLELLKANDRETEIEGILESIVAESSTTSRARMLNIPVLLDGRTKVRGVEVSTSAIRPAPGLEDDPFSPQRLRTGEGLVIEEQLFDLQNDPGEQVNRARDEPQRAASLRGELFRWLDRMAQSPRTRGGSRVPLDHETIERLRTLGYVN